MEQAAGSPTAAAAATPTARQRLAALGEVLACSGVLTQIAAAKILAEAGYPLRQITRLTSGYVLWFSMLDSALLLGLMALLLRLHGQSPASLFLVPGRPWRRDVLIGLALVPFIFLLVTGMLLLIKYHAPGLYTGDSNPLEALIRTRADVVRFAVVGVVAGGLREELQRAFVLRRFDRYLGGARLGLVLFSLLFGLGHYLQGWDAAIVTAILGVIWGGLFLMRGSVVAPIISHASFDVLEVIRYHLFG